jgi:uncharacterized cofD-like protein
MSNIETPSTESLMRVAVIGGGTGNSTVLAGLKPWARENLTAIVNTFDDGGIAVGDLRQCARAMSNLHPDSLHVLEDRFGLGSGLSDMNVDGQTVGNLIFEKAHQSFAGDPERIIAAYSDIYQVVGKVLPVSHDSRRLRITLPDGNIIDGEHNAEETEISSFRGSIIGFDMDDTDISPEAEAAIAEADMVVLAPGDLYTSLAPTLVVRGMREALSKATAVVQVSNLMNRNRHTVGFSVLDYAAEYERIIGARVIDRVLYNTADPDAEALAAQAEEGSYKVRVNEDELTKAGISAVGKDLISRNKVILGAHDKLAHTRSQIRHDPAKVAHALVGIFINNGFAAR